MHSAQLLVTLGWIEVSERQSDKKHSTDNITGRTVEQVMHCIGESERPASENCHLERPNVGDRVLEAEIYEDEYNKNQYQDLRNLVLAA